MNKVIYLDNAATTKTAPEVVQAMLPYFTENYGNPSSVYSFASKNKEAISKQRDIIADALGAKANEAAGLFSRTGILYAVRRSWKRTH